LKPLKLTQDIDCLRDRVDSLEEQVSDLREAISVLLGRAEVGQLRKDELLSSIEINVPEEEEAPVKKVEYDKTIQQLLDESQRPDAPR
jgi:hypothetical protein